MRLPIAVPSPAQIVVTVAFSMGFHFACLSPCLRYLTEVEDSICSLAGVTRDAKPWLQNPGSVGVPRQNQWGTPGLVVLTFQSICMLTMLTTFLFLPQGGGGRLQTISV